MNGATVQPKAAIEDGRDRERQRIALQDLVVERPDAARRAASSRSASLRQPRRKAPGSSRSAKR